MQDQLIKTISDDNLAAAIEKEGPAQFFAVLIPLHRVLHPELHEVVEEFQEQYQRILDILEGEGIEING